MFDDMNVSLTAELEHLVAAKVRTGRYLSASEVVREALRLLEERDKLQERRLAQFGRTPAERGRIHEAIEEGMRAAERGEVLTEAEFERDLRAQRRRRRAGR